ncbi:protein DpdF [Duganella fentianensis]|uniref:protein DpdF n=1 Tax=Duganella fentianensis TaxID=2692177 RepID=UPI0032B2C6F7
MTFDFIGLQALIRDWDGNSEIFEGDFQDGIYERLCQILLMARQQQTMALLCADLQPLVRHCLLAESARTEQTEVLWVPATSGWPSAQDWAMHSVQAMPTKDGAFVISAQEWDPSWLSSASGGVFHDAFTDKRVRTEGACPADPFITDATGFTTYSSQGQRDAVRAVFLMRQGETLLVNLPTGSGKSLVGQAPALVRKLAGALTIFVVPTVALALDQERAMRAFIQKAEGVSKEWPLAWHSGLDDVRRAEIRTRLRDGTQRILFTSPEALTTSLLSAVTEAAHAGMLQYLVIDEAHLVTGWGDAFRPAFQLLAGLRHGLLQVSPRGFRTVLLSATYTQETIETLATLFGPVDKVQMVSAVHLRPEPQYWFYYASDSNEKQERVLEALRHAPRPFILYVTTRAEIRHWEHVLKNIAGLRRLACFDGSTATRERAVIIKDWVDNRLDGIVATSAFGVGIDKGDVRTVIHATIPETLDRYYQEVGRGGRDGRPCVSLLVYEDRDWTLPERLARPAIISEELGISRWKAMFDTRRHTGQEDVYEIDIEARHSKLRSSSEYNVDWNMRTLILMVRAGLIALDVGVIEGVSPTAYPEHDEASSLLSALAKIRVRILDGGHLRQEVWQKRVADSRSTTLQASDRNLSLMRGLLKGNCEVGKTLAELYRVNSGPWPVSVTRVCGGCPQDRFDSAVRRRYRMPTPIHIKNVDSAEFSEWIRCFPWVDPTFVYVFYEDDRPAVDVSRDLVRFVNWLVQECGVREVVTSEQGPLARLPEWRRLYRRSAEGIVLHRRLGELEPYTPLARVTVLDAESAASMLDKMESLERPYHIVLLPRSQPDPSNPLRKLADIIEHAAFLQQLLPIISQ